MAVAGDVVPHHRHPAGGGPDEPEREADERGLAGAVGAEEPEALAPPDGQVDALDADRPPVHPGEGRGLDGVIHGTGG